jgi:adenylosuccinate synthase
MVDKKRTVVDKIKSKTKKSVIDQLEGVDICLAVKLIHETMSSDKSAKEKFDLVSAFVEGLEEKVQKKLSVKDKLDTFYKELDKWIEEADKKCKANLKKLGISKKNREYYIDLEYQMEKKG